jgi:hypothetical protein
MSITTSAEKTDRDDCMATVVANSTQVSCVVRLHSNSTIMTQRVVCFVYTVRIMTHRGSLNWHVGHSEKNRSATSPPSGRRQEKTQLVGTKKKKKKKKALQCVAKYCPFKHV